MASVATAVPQVNATPATPAFPFEIAPPSPPLDTKARQRIVARLRRIARRHHLRIVSYHLADGRYGYCLEAKVPLLAHRTHTLPGRADRLLQQPRSEGGPLMKMLSPCPGCGAMLDDQGCDVVKGFYHFGPGGCANERYGIEQMPNGLYAIRDLCFDPALGYKKYPVQGIQTLEEARVIREKMLWADSPEVNS